jgi:hypothetical protein
MTNRHEVPTDPETLAALLADVPNAEPIDDAPEIDAPRLALVAEVLTADGRRIRTYSNRPQPTTTKENPEMTTKRKPTEELEVSHVDTSAEAILSTDTVTPRHLIPMDAEAWTEATAELSGWLNTDGAPLHITTADTLAADYRRAAPSTPPALARVKVAQALARLLAMTPYRLATVQTGDDTGADPVFVLMAVPDGTRLAADGYEAVVVIWWPDGTYDFTDEVTGQRVSIPSLYKGRASGYARVWRNVEDAMAEFDRLKDAVRTMRRLARAEYMAESRGDDDDDTPPTAAQSVI